ncbi:hypothetical protein HLB23_31730 [Nocardia uniformis]|uniref:Uncharacterized protein n=1 Tax=Nocardia uniformis TaxID=53432 RepID=A0A849C9G9_9NOCA|nr:hypothetical protein [Nocardia uniformis]NNH74368.1 hypothetical protein [Nocardia uniformis]
MTKADVPEWPSWLGEVVISISVFRCGQRRGMGSLAHRQLLPISEFFP